MITVLWYHCTLCQQRHTNRSIYYGAHLRFRDERIGIKTWQVYIGGQAYYNPDLDFYPAS